MLRVARPTDRLDDVVRFYTEGLGLSRLSAFCDHEGFDGVMVGAPGGSYHLEFTHQRGHGVGRAPTREHLLVFYLPDSGEWHAAVDRMIAAGHLPVEPMNRIGPRTGFPWLAGREQFAPEYRVSAGAQWG